MSKAQVNIQTAISFLQQITGRNNTSPATAAKIEQIKIMKQNTSAFKHPKHFVPPVSPLAQKQDTSNIDANGDESMEFKKFHETANIIEDTLVKFYQNDEDIYHNIERSSETRLNIYYRQNARILKQIRVQNQIVRSNNEGNIEEKEARLNKEFMFTVKDDCRDFISICITKAQQKLSKMIEDEATFKMALVVMVDNQLKIYRDTTENKLQKIIRMYEIEHISYNQQPVKCIVVSFIKDKSKPAEHLYLKFDNNQDHDKWDRIIFINRKLYKMNKKQNLFEAEFDKKEKVNQFKQASKYQRREVDVIDTIKVLCEEENKNKERSKLQYQIKARQRQEKLYEKDKEKEKQKQKEKQKEKDQMTFKQFSVYGGKQLMEQRSRQEFPYSRKDTQVKDITDNMTRSLLNPHQKQLMFSPEAPYQRANTNEFGEHGSYISPSIRIDLVDPNSFNNQQGMIQPSIRVIQKSQIFQQDSHLQRQRQKQSNLIVKISKLQKQLQKGLYVTKINFLRNSKKIIFLKDASFIYINQDQFRSHTIALKNKQPTKQPQTKQIKILHIDKIDRLIHQESKQPQNVQNKTVTQSKKTKQKKDKITLFLSNNKKFQIQAADLSVFSDWLKLKLNQLIRQE